MITAERVREMLHYDPETGGFLRRVAAGGSKAGAIAGALIKRNNYIEISLDNRAYLAHRLAWIYVHGTWPIGQIDHINGVRNDNRIINLRDVPPQLNSQNRRSALPTNKVGLLGVTSPRKNGRWVASLTINGRQTYIGSFRSPEEAHAAYLQAKRKHHEGCTL